MSRGGLINRWTNAENARLDELRGSGLDWESVAASMPGRSIGACQQQYSIRHRKPRRQQHRVTEPRQAPLVPFLQALPASPGGCRFSTAVLVADAELRARIALVGLTAGLLGDPLPGRSALDQRKAREDG